MSRRTAGREIIDVLGVPVARLSLKEVLQCVQGFVQDGGVHVVMYANVYTVNVAHRNADYRRVLKEADLVYCDGAGIKLGARILGHELAERMTGADWIHDLCRLCVREKYRLFLFGSRPGVADRAAESLRQRHKGLTVVGTSHGYLGAEDETELMSRITAACPDILLVGLGTPKQEFWLTGMRSHLQVPVCWAVGGLFDFAAGELPRAPHWMRDHGLEWLFRLFVEPDRLWRRYLFGNTVFIVRVLLRRLTAGLGTRR